MEMRILGPLEIVAEGHPLDLPTGKVRLLLAALVVHANQVVSTDRLFELGAALLEGLAQLRIQDGMTPLR
jgi:hypothetical protein